MPINDPNPDISPLLKLLEDERFIPFQNLLNSLLDVGEKLGTRRIQDPIPIPDALTDLKVALLPFGYRGEKKEIEKKEIEPSKDALFARILHFEYKVTARQRLIYEAVERQKIDGGSVLRPSQAKQYNSGGALNYLIQHNLLEVVSCSGGRAVLPTTQFVELLELTGSKTQGIYDRIAKACLEANSVPSAPEDWMPLSTFRSRLRKAALLITAPLLSEDCRIFPAARTSSGTVIITGIQPNYLKSIEGALMDYLDPTGWPHQGDKRLTLLGRIRERFGDNEVQEFPSRVRYASQVLNTGKTCLYFSPDAEMSLRDEFLQYVRKTKNAFENSLRYVVQKKASKYSLGSQWLMFSKSSDSYKSIDLVERVGSTLETRQDSVQFKVYGWKILSFSPNEVLQLIPLEKYLAALRAEFS